MKFYDRELERGVISRNEVQSRTSATFTVLNGRRRVGKTALIMKATDGTPCAYLFVSKDNEAMLCRKFQNILEERLQMRIYGSVARFGDLFEIIMRESCARHFTIVLDEFQNFQKVNPAIFSEIQNHWDTYHTQSHLNLIVSGSVRSLMHRIFEGNGEPLYGRATSKLTLRPFTTATLKEILADHNPKYEPEDLLCLYMVTGGIAKYVELLMDSECHTKKAMLDYVCRPDSYFLTEGRDLMNQEFTDENATYFSLLQLIAEGYTRRSEIDGVMQKDMGTHLQMLERNYYLVERAHPLLARPGGKTSAYEIADQFLRFWFRFVRPFQGLIEQQQLEPLRKNIDKHYDQFSGRTLERYFRAKLMETGRYTKIGRWWDRKGENEIDLIALNEIDRSGVIAEIKRNPQKISLRELDRKREALPKAEFGQYTLKPLALSLDDM